MTHNYDADRRRERTQVYDLPPAPRALRRTSVIVEHDLVLREGESIPEYRARMDALRPRVGQTTMQPTGPRQYWPAVTDVPCPAPRCAGIIRWAEAGYVPGYRICDGCGRHFLAAGHADAPTLLRVG